MPEVIVLKPRRNNSPFRFNGVSYPQVEDEIGVVRINVDDPEFLKFMSENPDTFEVPANVVIHSTTIEEPAVVAEAENPVAVVEAVTEQAAAEPAAPAKGAGKRTSRLNG